MLTSPWLFFGGSLPDDACIEKEGVSLGCAEYVGCGCRSSGRGWEMPGHYNFVHQCCRDVQRFPVIGSVEEELQAG